MSSNHDGEMFRSLNSPVHRLLRVSVSRYRSVGWIIVFALACPNLIGCQALQHRTSRRSAQCESLCAQARAARAAGNEDRANQCLNEALRQHPSGLETRRRLAETMWNSGRQVEAVAQLAVLREQYPDDAKLAAKLAVMQWETNQRLAASKTAIETLQLDPQSKEAWLIKARAETERGELDEALVSYLRLSQVAPDDLSAQMELGELHLNRGHPDRACPLFRAALLHPLATAQQKVEMEWLLGVAYAKSERWSEAIEVMERLIAIRDVTADDWCFLGWTRMHAGDLAGAQSALHHAQLAEPDSLAVRRFARQLKTSSQTSSRSRQVSAAGDQDD